MNTHSEYTDLQLLRSLSGNDKQSFEILYNRYWEPLYKSAFYILKDQEACKDIVQNIFIWLWEHRQTQEIHSLSSYLRVAVKFKVANYIRSGKVRDSLFHELAHFDLPPAVHTPEEIMDLKELSAVIKNAVTKLPSKCQKIYLLSREEHLSNREIAQRLGISIKTVENQMTIAFRRLRSAVELQIISLILVSLIK